jgi:hypothetical protein
VQHAPVFGATAERYDGPMTASRYFVAAAIVLLLGASAMPIGIAAYTFASTSREPYAAAVGVWGSLVLIIALAGPIVLTFAGMLALGRREAGQANADGSEDSTDPRIDELMTWLSDQQQIRGRR